MRVLFIKIFQEEIFFWVTDCIALIERRCVALRSSFGL